MASEIPEIVFAFDPQLKFMEAGILLTYFAVSCSSLSEDSAEFRYVSLIKLSSAAAFARTSHYSNLNFTYEEDYNSFSTTQKKNSWICLDIAAFRPNK